MVGVRAHRREHRRVERSRRNRVEQQHRRHRRRPHRIRTTDRRSPGSGGRRGILAPADGQAHSVTPGSGLTEVHEQNTTQLFGRSLTCRPRRALSGRPRVPWSWTGQIRSAAVVISIKASRRSPPAAVHGWPDGGRDSPLRAHSPHGPGESFVPVDAKRYVESAALWAATAPFATQTDWGAAPLVKSRQTVGEPGQPGKYLGTADFLVADATRSASGTGRLGRGAGPRTRHRGRQHQPTRTVWAIFDAYEGRPEGQPVLVPRGAFDTARLSRLAATVAAPALEPDACQREESRAALLLPVLSRTRVGESGPLPQRRARNSAATRETGNASRCLLEGDGTTTGHQLHPEVLRHHRTRPAPVLKDGAEQYRPYAFDADGRGSP